MAKASRKKGFTYKSDTWLIKGISAEARNKARKLAHSNKETIGAWLNELIDNYEIVTSMVKNMESKAKEKNTPAANSTRGWKFWRQA